jgi:hypothetical protein
VEFFAYHRDRAGSTPLRAALTVPLDDLVGVGPLLSDDGAMVLGAAALTPSEAVARSILQADRWTGVEVHRWGPGGRR